MLQLRDSGWQAIMSTPFCYVYRLRSKADPNRSYVGLTDDLTMRLKKHNAGGSPHTAKWRPWELEVAISFASREKAAAFEKYLKTGSGREFARRHF